MMTVTGQRTYQGARFRELKVQQLNELLAEIEFRLGSWQDLQNDYKKNHGIGLKQSGLAGCYVVWMNYHGKTVFAQAMHMYEQEDRQGAFMFRLVLNSLSKMSASYDMPELVEFARFGDVLRAHLIEIGIMEKV